MLNSRERHPLIGGFHPLSSPAIWILRSLLHTLPFPTQGCTAGTSPSKMSKEGSHDEDEEETVDILTKDDARVMSSDEEEELEGQLHYLPAVRGKHICPGVAVLLTLWASRTLKMRCQ